MLPLIFVHDDWKGHDSMLKFKSAFRHSQITPSLFQIEFLLKPWNVILLHNHQHRQQRWKFIFHVPIFFLFYGFPPPSLHRFRLCRLRLSNDNSINFNFISPLALSARVSTYCSIWKYNSTNNPTQWQCIHQRSLSAGILFRLNASRMCTIDCFSLAANSGSSGNDEFFCSHFFSLMLFILLMNRSL